MNPRASGGRGSALRRRIAAAFAAHGVPFDLYEAPEPAGALEACARAAGAGCRAVVAAGGDGTVARALRATAGTEVPVAIVPCGTGNQLATNFGIPVSLEGAVRTAVEGVPEEIDLGRIDGEYFALISGAGLDAEMMADATAELKSRLGFGAYIYSALKNAVGAPSAEFRIVADGEEIRLRASMVLVANVGHLSAGSLPVDVQVAPRASFRDGLLDVCVFAPRNLPEMGLMLWKLARQEYAGDDRMIFLQARRVRVESDPPTAVQIDGEPDGRTPFEAEVVPRGGRILVLPRGAAGA